MRLLILILTLLIPSSAFCALQDDNFNDNTLDTSFWQTGVSVCLIYERNGQIEFVGSHGTSAQCNLYTLTTNDLSESDFSIDVKLMNSFNEIALWIVLTDPGTGNPYAQNDWYRIMKYNSGGAADYYVQKKVSGSATTLASGTWAANSGILRITVSGGTITFYENGTSRASETYALSSTNAYVVISARGSTGQDEVDDFLGSSGGATARRRFLLVK